jgi:predicted dehydrogenase
MWTGTRIAEPIAALLPIRRLSRYRSELGAMKPMARLGIGLIGVGKHGARYAQHLVADLPSARLVALARRDIVAARRQAAEFGCRAYGDYRELVADAEVNAVIAVVPPTLHPAIVEAAAAARRPILLEKPAAAGVSAAQRILAATRAARVPIMVAQTLRYNEVVQVVRRVRAEIGPIHCVRVSQRFEPSRPAWIDDPEVAGGGIALHTGVHSFDLVRVLTELEAERVSCEMSRVGTSRTEDNFCAVIRMVDPIVLATVAGSRATASRSGPIEIAGARGQLIADHVMRTVQIVRGTTITALEVPPPTPTVREALRDFVEAVQHDRPMPIPFEEGMRAVAIAEACYRSAASGRAESVARVD